MELWDDFPVQHNMGYSDLLWEGVDLTQYFRGFTVSRPVIAPVEVNELNIAGRDGALINGYRHEPLVITVTGALNAHERKLVEAIRQRLAFLLSPRGYLQNTGDGLGTRVLYVGERIKPDDPQYSSYIAYDAIMRGEITIDRQYAFPHVSIDFLVPSGFGYSWNTRSQTLSSGSNTITVGGNFPTYPTIEVVSRSSGDLRIAWSGSELTSKYIATSSTELVTIDCENESVTVGENEAPVAFDLGSDFFALYPNISNQINVSGGTVKLTWKEKWA